MRAFLALLLLASLALAAPVPPPPRLTEAGLAGTYYERWGGCYKGLVTFGADGTYRFDDAGGYRVYVGRWWLEGGSLVLMEQRLSVHSGDISGDVTRFEIPISGSGGVFTGTVRGSNAAFALTHTGR